MELDLMGYEVKELLTPLRIRRHEANVDRMASGHTSAILYNDRPHLLLPSQVCKDS